MTKAWIEKSPFKMTICGWNNNTFECTISSDACWNSVWKCLCICIIQIQQTRKYMTLYNLLTTAWYSQSFHYFTLMIVSLELTCVSCTMRMSHEITCVLPREGAMNSHGFYQKTEPWTHMCFTKTLGHELMCFLSREWAVNSHHFYQANEPWTHINS